MSETKTEHEECIERYGIITNPGSNSKLASGIAPISKYLEKGIEVAIGTDGPSSNKCLDFFKMFCNRSDLNDN